MREINGIMKLMLTLLLQVRGTYNTSVVSHAERTKDNTTVHCCTVVVVGYPMIRRVP